MYEREYLEDCGLTVCIERDDDAPNPRREFDHVGTMVCWHSRYDLGDENPDYSCREFFVRLMQEREYDVHGKHVPDEIARERVEEYIAKHFYVLPLYLYDHSGLSISTGGFACSWDSGQVGWIYMSEDKARAECVGDPIGLLKQEVHEYDQYLTGDVWGYQIEDENGVTLDSCWGFYGMDDCKSEASAAAAACAEQRAHDYTL